MCWHHLLELHTHPVTLLVNEQLWTPPSQYADLSERQVPWSYSLFAKVLEYWALSLFPAIQPCGGRELQNHRWGQRKPRRWEWGGMALGVGPLNCSVGQTPHVCVFLPCENQTLDLSWEHRSRCDWKKIWTRHWPHSEFWIMVWHPSDPVSLRTRD